MKPGDRLPDYTAHDREGAYRVVDVVLIERPIAETQEATAARRKAGKPAPMVSYCVGRRELV